MKENNRTESTKNELFLYGTDEVYITQISNGIVEGTFPANDEEVMLTPNSVTALGVQLGDSVTLHTPAGDRTFTISGFGTDDESYYNNQTYLIGSYLTQSAFTSVMAQNGVTNNELTYYVQFESAAKAANAITELQTQYQLSDGSISENTGVMGMAGQKQQYSDAEYVRIGSNSICFSVVGRNIDDFWQYE